MARRNGNAGGTAVDIGAFINQQTQRFNRLRELQKTQATLAKQEQSLRTQQQRVETEISQLMGGSTVTTPSPTRRGRPASTGNGRRGRRAKGNGTTGAKRGRPARGNGARQSRGTRGISAKDALLQVLPDNNSDPISKQDAVSAAVNAGWKSSSNKPDVVIGQALGKFTNLFSNPSRGMWRLTANGVKARDKANSTPDTGNGDASETDDNTTPQASGSAAPATAVHDSAPAASA